PEAIIVHYMDDILICAATRSYLSAPLKKTVSTIEKAGFVIAQDKIQMSALWTYLGYLITGRTVTPQIFSINEQPQALEHIQR
ncbi:POK25 protein, partial [Indicator maculatus]|nr:POK25 protein [Indicator maculatus]